MSPEEVRKFVSGKVFSFTCSDGTRGDGTFFDDGGAFGDITFPGKPHRAIRLPENTLQVRGASICASIKGMPVEPCFDLDKTGSRSFRGAVTGMDFMYCDFVHRPDLKLGRREAGQIQSAPAARTGRPGPPKRLTP
jgi:hypothetical protein